MNAPAPDYTIPNAAWSGHHLLFADEELVDNKLRRPLLSPSVAAGYNGCPARTAVDRLMPRVDDPFAANELGTSFHTVMEDLYQLPPEERTREMASELLRRRADETWATSKLARQDRDSLKANAENRARWVAEIETLIDGQFQIETPHLIEVESVEFLLNDVVIGAGVGGRDGIPLKGYVDRTRIVYIDGRPFRWIDDYKAGKAKLNPDLRFGDDYGDQQRIYAEGYAQSTGERPAGATLLFPRGPGKREIDLSPDAMRKTLLGFRAGWDTMNGSADRRSYEAIPSNLCSWCPAVNSCPIAKLSNKPNAVESRAKQPSALQLGIPRLRPGAGLQEVRDAPGVTVPLSKGPNFEAPIQPQKNDLFPVTMLEAGETERDVRAALAADAANTPVAEAATTQPPIIPDSLPGAPDVAETITRLTDAVLFSPEEILATTAEQTVHVVNDSRHETPTNGETMTDQTTPDQPMGVRGEAAPYEPVIGDQLNLNSYSAIAVANLVSLAFEHMRDNGIAPKPASLNKFSHVLAGILLRSQKQMTGFAGWQQGANSRLRYFLRTALRSFPAPFLVLSADGTTKVPATLEDWQMWMARIEKLLNVSLQTAMDVFANADQASSTSPEAFFAVGGAYAPAPVAVLASTAAPELATAGA